MKARNVVAGLVFLASSFAMAYPMVGDKSEWTGTVVGPNGTKEAKASMEVLSQDPTTMKWRVKSWMQVGTWERCETRDKSRLYTPEKWADILANCESKGGVIGEITVPAGTFNTCMMTKMDRDQDESMVVYWGDVPFGVVKVVKTDDGKVKTMELSSVTAGTPPPPPQEPGQPTPPEEPGQPTPPEQPEQ